MDEGIVKYYIYHIPKRKEWGCTKNLNNRLRQLGYNENDLDRVIICGNEDMAADMERDLNIEYGYGWNETRDYRVITNVSKTGRIKGGKISKENNSRAILSFDKITGEFIKEYHSVHEAAREFHTSNGNITNILKERRPSLYGLKFKYKDNAKI